MSIWLKLENEFRKFPILAAQGVTDDVIDLAEIAVGMEFPESYREFLRRYGGAIVGSVPIFGLVRAEPMGDNLWSVVDVTERFRREKWPGVEAWCIVSMDGAGNPVGFDRQGQIWLSDHDTHEVVMMAATFEALLERSLPRE
jgi:cell wall assembly regulator SMI1